ncbi:flagellar basal body L-ring protein FlgH [Noviherbaspirillum sp. Root189]|uniref:flagellar basal body L-ring protein FlgH n=1 Tax=Noviherbaspirillum sp. Root189 TaxID=1736487 RepID=UPI00070D3204|nr:flagellar basal body L-ring protein FlgH [Noviherbaspirillum sp. Root189]KRB93336.1 flagellar biosynthesis protein FlgH [Noviherbaspirillum sp. Root189]
MKRVGAIVLYAVMAAAMVGCATVPDTITHQPAAARPPMPTPVQPSNGAIFQASAYRPMFEDRRARLVGDTIIIAISEKTSAGKSEGNSASKTGSVSFAAPTLFGVPSTTTAKLGLSASSSNKYEEKDATTASNNFTGTITVTVAEVLPNGNLVVSGEKQVSFDKGVEFVRFSGIVNPDNIVSGNVVASTQVADARVEYRTNSRIDKAEMMSQMTRFFLSLLPL